MAWIEQTGTCSLAGPLPPASWRLRLCIRVQLTEDGARLRRRSRVRPPARPVARPRRRQTKRRCVGGSVGRNLRCEDPHRTELPRLPAQHILPRWDTTSLGTITTLAVTVWIKAFRQRYAASPESTQNPRRANSTLWYRVTLPDGRTGYLREIYVVPEDRGGKGLPACR